MTALQERTVARLTDPEIQAIAALLDINVRELSEPPSGRDLQEVILDGWRSLVARGMARIEDQQIGLAPLLLDQATIALSPAAVLTYVFRTADTTLHAAVMVREGRLVVHSLVIPGVHQFVEVSADELVDMLARASGLNTETDSEGVVELYRAQPGGSRDSEPVRWQRKDGRLTIVAVGNHPASDASTESVQEGIMRLVDKACSIRPPET